MLNLLLWLVKLNPRQIGRTFFAILMLMAKPYPPSLLERNVTSPAANVVKTSQFFHRVFGFEMREKKFFQSLLRLSFVKWIKLHARKEHTFEKSILSWLLSPYTPDRVVEFSLLQYLSFIKFNPGQKFWIIMEQTHEILPT